MTSEELAEEVERAIRASIDGNTLSQAEEDAIVAAARGRILGIGAEQYAEGDQQKFETMELSELVEYVREEALDLINYGVMLTIRIDRLAQSIEGMLGEAYGVAFRQEDA